MSYKHKLTNIVKRLKMQNVKPDMGNKHDFINILPLAKTLTARIYLIHITLHKDVITDSQRKFGLWVLVRRKPKRIVGVFGHKYGNWALRVRCRLTTLVGPLQHGVPLHRARETMNCAERLRNRHAGISHRTRSVVIHRCLK